MAQTVLNRTAEPIGESARQAPRATSAVVDAITEDGVGVVRRAARHSGDAAEEFLNDTSQRIRRQPALMEGPHLWWASARAVGRLHEQTKIAHTQQSRMAGIIFIILLTTAISGLRPVPVASGTHPEEGTASGRAFADLRGTVLQVRGSSIPRRPDDSESHQRVTKDGLQITQGKPSAGTRYTGRRSKSLHKAVKRVASLDSGRADPEKALQGENDKNPQ